MLPLTSSVEFVPVTVATTAVAVVANEEDTAFKTNDAELALNALEAVTVLSAIEADIALFAHDAVRLFVTPLTTVIEPLTLTLPVNWWVLVIKVPNLVDPVTKSWDEVIV